MNKRLIITLYLGFITIGVINNIISPLLPVINTEISMNYGQMGYILSGQYFGTFFTVAFGGYIADKFGKKLLLIIGSAFLLSGLTGSMLSHNYIQLLCWNAITGLGFGTYTVGINSLCADESSGDNKGGALNFLNSVFGIGAILGPILVTLCVRTFESWRLTFAIALLLTIAVVILLVPLKSKEHLSSEKGADKIPFNDLFIWFVGLSTFLYVGIESSVFGWIPIYWDKLPSNNLMPATLIGTIFWGTMTVGRFICGFITDKLGFPKFLLITSGGTVLSSVLWLLFHSSLATFSFILFIGLFLAGIFPTILASMTSYYPSISGKITSFVMIFASLGGLLVPTFIGRFADKLGIAIFPIIIFIMTVLMVLGIYTAWFRINKKKNNQVQ